MENKTQAFLIVDIVEYTDDSFPGWARCSFTDCGGRQWEFTEKRPVIIGGHEIAGNADLPLKGHAAGTIVSRADGKVLFDLSLPWGIEADGGKTSFLVYESQIINIESADAADNTQSSQ